jgi:hypothetical protein
MIRTPAMDCARRVGTQLALMAALEDDFGARLVRNKGTVPRELDI